MVCQEICNVIAKKGAVLLTEYEGLVAQLKPLEHELDALGRSGSQPSFEKLAKLKSEIFTLQSKLYIILSAAAPDLLKIAIEQSGLGPAVV